MPRRTRKSDENSSSSSDPDFVAPRYSTHRFVSSSRTNLHSVRRSTRTKSIKVTQPPMEVEMKNENKNYGRKRQNGKCNNILSWLINFGTIKKGTTVQYMDGGLCKLEGKISCKGILCSCCNYTVTVAEFERHAGSNKHTPYENIYSVTGRSLLMCQLEAWESLDMSACCGLQMVDIQKDDIKKNDDICNICGGDGLLICCDLCPLTYHKDCVGIETLPEDPFHCPICLCTICGMGASNYYAFRCYQCEELYHLSCLGEAHAAVDGKNFCGRSCMEVNLKLEALLGVTHEIGDGLSWTLSQRIDAGSVSRHGLPGSMDCNGRVALAYAVYDECFEPILDSRTGFDMIPTVVFNCGSNLSRLHCRGFYTFTMERKEEVIAAASIRVHGTKIAEMPFIGTRQKYRRQGTCRQLIDAIESVLVSLNVQKMVLPSTPERVKYWTTHFGFKQVSKTQRKGMLSMNLIMFRDAVLLQKTLLPHDGSNEGQNEANEVLRDNNEPQGRNPNNGLGDREDEPPNPLPFDLNLEPPNENPNNGLGDREDEPPNPLLFDLNLEAPNEEVNINILQNEEEVDINILQDEGEGVNMNYLQNGGGEEPSLGIFLTLDPDGCLKLKQFFANRSPECLQSYSF